MNRAIGIESALTLSKEQLTLCLVVYGFVASILPVWMLLTPRDYLSTFMKVGVIVLLAIGMIFAAPVLQAPAVTDFAREGTGPVFAGKLFPFVFITIACGALSGFHALIASGTTPKMVAKESQVRMIGYGAMLMESFVAISALIAACVIDPGLYYAINSPLGATGGDPATASEFVTTLGFSISPDALTAAAQSVDEATLISRTGGAPTLAFGMSQILGSFLGGSAMTAFWYHFAIMFEALFILTTVDAGTRVARFMLSDTLGNLGGPLKKFRDPSWRVGAWICSIVVCGLWGAILLMGVTDPLGGINTLFPLFGIANQLLAAMALALVTVVVVKKGYLKWAWIPAVPLLWDLAVTMTASYQKIFSPEPSLGYWAQHNAFREARAAGETSFGTAADPAAMDAVIRNTFLQGTLSIIFAVLVLVVALVALWVCVKAIRAGGLPTTEEPDAQSTTFAPSGLISSDAEKEVAAQWTAYYEENPDKIRTGTHA